MMPHPMGPPTGGPAPMPAPGGPPPGGAAPGGPSPDQAHQMLVQALTQIKSIADKNGIPWAGLLAEVGHGPNGGAPMGPMAPPPPPGGGAAPMGPPAGGPRPAGY